MRSGADDDSVLLLLAATLLMLNCIVAPLNYHRGSVSSAIILDSLFDSMYLVLNSIRTILRKEALRLSDALSMAYPLISISYRLSSYARYSIAEHAEKTNAKASSLHTSMRRVFAPRTAPCRIYKALLGVLTFVALVLGAGSFTIVIKILESTQAVLGNVR